MSATKLLTCSLPLFDQRQGYPIPVQTQSVLELDSGHANHLIAADFVASTICVASGSNFWISTDRTKDSDFSLSKFVWKHFTTPNPVTSVACFGETLALGEQSGKVRIYFDVIKAGQTGRLPPETVINWHQSPISSLQISNNGIQSYSCPLLIM